MTDCAVINESSWHEFEDVTENALRELIEYVSGLTDSDFGWVNVVLLDSDSHTQLNYKYLSHGYPTDILTFDFSEGTQISCEIYINVAVMIQNALYYGVDNFNELCRLMAHGLLHSIGYNDENSDEQAEMKIQEDACLAHLSAKGFM